MPPAINHDVIHIRSRREGLAVKAGYVIRLSRRAQAAAIGSIRQVQRQPQLVPGIRLELVHLFDGISITDEEGVLADEKVQRGSLPAAAALAQPPPSSNGPLGESHGIFSRRPC